MHRRQCQNHSHFGSKYKSGPCFAAGLLLLVALPEHIWKLGVGSLPSQQLFGLGMKMKHSVSNKSARVRQKPASCSVTACVLLHITHASYEGFSISFGSDKTRRQNRCPSCAGIISSCHLWGLGGGGQLLSPSPALHVESSPTFSLQTARLA